MFVQLKMPKDTIGYWAVNILITFALCSYVWMIFRANQWNDMVEITKGYFRSGGVYIHQINIFFLIGASFCLSRISKRVFSWEILLTE